MIRNRLYNFFVRKNGRVWYEYERYVREHMEEHHLHRIRHLRVLFKLNWFYRIKKGNTPYLYWDVPLEPQVEEKGSEIKSDIPRIENVKKEEKKNNREVKKEVVEKKEIYPESYDSGMKRMDAYHYAQRLFKYDAVSFDLFDTLILRKVYEPTDIFMIVGNRLNIYRFKEIREKAERRARIIKKSKYGNEEVTIYDIYNEVAKEVQINIEDAIRTEYETEMEFCICNSYFKKIYDILISNNIDVYVTSDMYYSRDSLEKFLDFFGYKCIKKIFVSCDYGCSKIRGNGALFRMVKKYLGEDKKIIHIGDNLTSDYKNAKNNNIDAIHYPACKTFNQKRKIYGISPIINSAYQSMLCNMLHTDETIYDKDWEFGYKYMGIFLVGYATWIDNIAHECKADSVVFLARDGYLFKQCYDMLGTDIKSHYVAWSRLAACRINLEKDYLIEKMIMKNVNKITIGECLEYLELEEMMDKFEKHGFEYWMPLCNENIHIFIEVFNALWENIEVLIKKNREKMKEYIKGILKEEKRIVVVDIGFSGANLYEFEKIAREACENMEIVKKLYVGNESATVNDYDMKCLDFQCYCFDGNFNNDIRRICEKEKDIFNGLMERLFSTYGPTFIGFDRKGEMRFRCSEVKNMSKIKKIQKGAIEFCENYIDYYRNENAFFAISGSDAIMPMIHLMKDKDMVMDMFGDLTQDLLLVPNEVIMGKMKGWVQK